jgi:dolichol-phosphate mannosyltransferase
MDGSPKFSFVIPLYNEVEVCDKLVQRMDRLMQKISEPCEVVFIDDGSTDGTTMMMEHQALSDIRYQSIFLSRNFGHQFALSAGLQFARGDFIMVLDGDLQDPPELFFDFYSKMQEGYDVVYGIRKKRKENLLKKTAYHLFYRVLKLISDYKIPLDSGDFALISKRVAKTMTSLTEYSRFLRGLRSWVGFQQTGIEYERQARKSGDSKYTFRKLVRLGSDGVFNFSTFPIRFFFFLGSGLISLSVFYFIYTIIRRIFVGDVPQGFTALLFMILLFGGIQLFAIGVIGEYVQRIFFQVKNRPLFIVSKRIVNGTEARE